MRRSDAVCHSCVVQHLFRIALPRLPRRGHAQVRTRRRSLCLDAFGGVSPLVCPLLLGLPRCALAILQRARLHAGTPHRHLPAHAQICVPTARAHRACPPRVPTARAHRACPHHRVPCCAPHRCMHADARIACPTPPFTRARVQATTAIAGGHVWQDFHTRFARHMDVASPSLGGGRTGAARADLDGADSLRRPLRIGLLARVWRVGEERSRRRAPRLVAGRRRIVHHRVWLGPLAHPPAYPAPSHARAPLR